MAEWYEDFKELVCRIYEIWGGDCDDLQWPDGGQEEINTLNNLSNNGTQLPGFASDKERAEYETVIGNLKTHLSSPNSTLSAIVDQQYDDFVAAQEQALANAGSS